VNADTRSLRVVRVVDVKGCMSMTHMGMGCVV